MAHGLTLLILLAIALWPVFTPTTWENISRLGDLGVIYLGCILLPNLGAFIRIANPPLKEHAKSLLLGALIPMVVGFIAWLTLPEYFMKLQSTNIWIPISQSLDNFLR
jgi:hypothetical protein